MHILITNGVPEKYTIGQLRRDNPNTSFPKVIPDDVLAKWNVFPLQRTDRPSVDYTKTVTEGTPALKDGVWVQVWDVADASAEEVQKRIAEKAASVRSERDGKLKDTDWIVIKSYERNENVPGVWEVYRQALRDITAQNGFPFDVAWPTKPE